MQTNDDRIIFEKEQKMWENYFTMMIENADTEEEKNLYITLRQEKRDLLGGGTSG